MKNIVVTGTSRGIGLELVKYFAEKGHQILALSRNDKPVKQLNLKNVTSLSCDLSKAEELQQVEEFVSSEWSQVDVLVHNAGAIVNKAFGEISSEEMNRVYQVNVVAVMQLTQRLLPKMSKDGHVVAVSTMGAVQGSVKFPGLSVYSSSKAAVITFMEVLAEEYKEEGLAFNTLALGAVQTEMLAEAFPGYEAPHSAEKMAGYIGNFALTGQEFYNGKLMQVSNSTP